MKNIILVILAILFIIMILFHFMDVQLEHFDCIAYNDKDEQSRLYYSSIPDHLLQNIQDILYTNGNGKYTDDSIVTNLINLRISDSSLANILTNHERYPSSADKISKFKCVFKDVIQKGLDDGLIIYYPLDKIHSDGKTITNEAASLRTRYNGELEGNILPTLDSNEVRGKGTKSMKFGGKSPTEGGSIRIPELPTFWNKSNTKFEGFSLAVWAKSSSYPLNNNWSKLVDFATGSQQNNNIFVCVTNTYNANRGDLTFMVLNGSEATNDTDKTSSYGLTYIDSKGNGVVDDVWRHYVFTISSSDSGNIIYSLYVNGVLMNSNYSNLVSNSNQSGNSVSIITGPDPTLSKPPNNIVRNNNYIGKSNFPRDSYFNGYMADFRIYKKELTADVVKKLYDSVNPVINTSSGQMFSPSILSSPSVNGAIPAFPGASTGPPPKLNILLFGNDTAITTKNGILNWADTSGFGNHAIASDASVQYCKITGKVTVPSGSYMDIAINPQCNYAAPVTIFFVADLKTFNPPSVKSAFGSSAHQYLFASPNYDGLEIIFRENTILCTIIARNYVMENLNMSGISGNGRNVYVVQYDAQDATVRVWINSSLVLNKRMPNNTIGQNKTIRLGAALNNPIIPSSENIDYHQIAHFSGILSNDYIQALEVQMATAWSIKSKINASNPYLTYQFN